MEHLSSVRAFGADFCFGALPNRSDKIYKTFEEMSKTWMYLDFYPQLSTVRISLTCNTCECLLR